MFYNIDMIYVKLLIWQKIGIYCMVLRLVIIVIIVEEYILCILINLKRVAILVKKNEKDYFKTKIINKVQLKENIRG